MFFTMQLLKLCIASQWNGWNELVSNTGLTQKPISVMMRTTAITIYIAAVLNTATMGLLGFQESEPVK